MNATDTLSEPEQELVASEGRAAPIEIFWESLTADQLRDIVRRGFAGGDHFAAAAAELERRSQARTAVAHFSALERERRRKMILRLLQLAGLAMVIALGLMILFRALG